MKRIAIHAEDLSFTYPGASKPALRGLGFDIYEGEHTALLGANGSGKSTLLKCLNGLLRPPSGRISVYGLDPGDESALEGIRRLLGTVLQNPDDQIISSVVEEDVAFGPENLGLRGEELRLRVDKVLDLCDLGALRQRPVRFLSGGERQRLALAGALALDTGGIILDEAVSMLDPAGREAFLKLLERLNGEGKTIIQITHSLKEALRCKRCLVLSGGVLVFDGPPWDLMEREELEEWGFSLPESIRALRLLFASPAAAGDFRVRCLDPEETAEEISRLKGLPEFREKAARFTGAPPARTPAPLRETPPPSAQVPQTLRFEAASHNYLEGTGLAVPAMENVDFELPSGAGLTVALIGRSGSGKSTVLKHINALLLPGSGRVIVLGEDTLDRKVNLPALRSRVSLSVQNPESALFETYTADDVACGPAAGGLRGEALLERVKNAMEEAGLPFGEFADRRTRSLSGGEKRQAAVAGAAAMEGEILLLDEPMAGLDGVHRLNISAMIEKLKERGKTVIVSTHSMEDALAFDLAAVMAEGRLAAFGAPREIFGEAWDPSWGLALPWTVSAARSLAEKGLVPRNAVPLNAEELAALIYGKVPADAKAPSGPAAGFTGGAPAPAAGEAFAGPGIRGGPLKGRAGGRRKKTGLEFFHSLPLGRFLDRPSPLRNLSAGWKLALLLFCAAAASGPSVFFPLGVLALTLGAARIWGKTGPGPLLKGFIPAAPWFFLIIAFQLLFMSPDDPKGPPVSFLSFSPAAGELLRAAPVFLRAAGVFLRAAAVFLRIAAFAALLSLYSAVTPLRETLGALKDFFTLFAPLGFPAGDLSLAAGITLRFVPVFAEEAERIVCARLSRGGRGGKTGMIFSMALPLFLRVLERSETLVSAMTLRLYRRG